MQPDTRRPWLSRRQFLQFAGVTSALGLTGALIGYQAECAVRPAPLPKPSPRTAPPDDASAPILLVTHAQTSNPFGLYLGEVLRAEGLHAFRTVRLDAVEGEDLSRHRLILLTEGSLSDDQANRLRDYVTDGGQLIAMRPDARLAALMGVTFTGGEAADGYMRVAANHPIAQGISAEPMQFHGMAQQLRLEDAEAIAMLCTRAGTATEFPLVAWHVAGKGRAALWAFDLARSVALTRQGNPAWANQERDGLAGVRACDMFVGWMDLERVAIPQADEQQRLLVNLIQTMCAERGPLPRLWYFPDGAGAALVATGDSHQNIAPNVERVLQRVERYGGHMSVYYSPLPFTCERRLIRKARWWPGVREVVGEGYPLPSPANIADWRVRGHEFTMHPFVEAGVEQGYNDYWNNFVKLGYGPISSTTRTHRILWQGWAETARVQAMYGIRMNLDYYHVGPAFLGADGESVYGHFTGSGLPMKFVDEQGETLDVYQQNTQLVDEHLLDALGGAARLSMEAAIAVSRQLMDEGLKQFPAALAMQAHIDPYELGGPGAENAGRWLEGTLEHAAANRIPILSAERWLAFTEARHDAQISGLTWEAAQNRLTFEMTTPPTAFDLELLVPLEHVSATLKLMYVDDQERTPESERTLGGVRYAAVRVASGQHTVTAQYAA